MSRTSAGFVARSELEGTTGVVVAIDVLRAFTTAVYAFDNGAQEVRLVGGVEEAIALKGVISGALVMGEDHGLQPKGFDLSNSPVAVSKADPSGKTLIQRTSAGTQGVIAARGAERLFAASLVCASATATSVNHAALGAPTYVITGRFQDRPAGGEDDLITAEYIECIRTGREADHLGVAEAVANTSEARRTLALGPDHVDPADVEFATDVDRFDFAMEVERVGERLRLVRREVPN